MPEARQPKVEETYYTMHGSFFEARADLQGGALCVDDSKRTRVWKKNRRMI